MPGVGFAVMLVFIQIGLFLDLLDSASIIIERLGADLWVTARNTPNVDFATTFPEGYVQRVRSVPGVGRADNLIVWFAQVPLPSGASEQVLYYAREDFEAWDFPWQIDEGGRDDLRRGRYVFLDVSAEKRFGPFAVGDYREFQGVRLKVIGRTREALSFTTTPLAFLGYRMGQALAPDELRNRTTYIVIKLTPGAVVLLAQPPIVLPSDTSAVVAFFGEGPGAITSRTLEKHRRGKCHHIQNTQATHVDPHARAGGLEHRVDRRGRPSDHPAGDDDATPGAVLDHLAEEQPGCGHQPRPASSTGARRVKEDASEGGHIVQRVGLDVLEVHPPSLDQVGMETLAMPAGSVLPGGDGPLIEAEGGDDRLRRAAVAEQSQHDVYQVGRHLPILTWPIISLILS